MAFYINSFFSKEEVNEEIKKRKEERKKKLKELKGKERKNENSK